MTIHEAANLAEAFRAACAHHADVVALVCRGQELTYADLHDRVRTVAGNLAHRAGWPGGGAPGAAVPGGGSGAEVPIVAVVIEPSPALICAVLGTVVAGMAYLPLDPAAPDEYLNQILADAGPLLVVTSPGRAGRLKCDSGEIVAFGELHAPAGRAAGSGGAAAPGGTDPAYVIYTSGSTGTPKGVVVSHRALLNSTTARLLAYGVPRRIPLVHSIAFDLSSGVVFWALLSGGTLIISADKLTDVAATLDLIREHDITHLAYPASLYAPFLDRASLAPPSGLQHVMIGSERWSSVLIGRHAALLPGTSLHNEYGPSEACVWSSSACVYDSETRRQAPMTLGTPILNTGYLVLDERGAPVTGGGHGELCITGANLATGYLHNPDLTAQRFIFLADGTRAYRTGDLVEVTGEGGYVFAGRADRQIKVQGNRIEAGHVETLLMSHELVQQCHVMARNDSGMGSALVAYLVAQGRAGHPDGWQAASLGAYLAERLPAYMIPSAYVVLGELPRTLNGKIDEARLPAPASIAADAVAPADVLEARLAAVIGGILGAGEIGVETALGTLGANSLAFVRISAAITRDQGVDIPLSVLFTGQTARAIARQVRSARRSDRPPLARKADTPLTAPLSAQQHQIWILHNFSPDSFAYTTQFSVRLAGTVDVPRLEDALSRIVERHEILRTTFHDSEDGPFQKVHPPWRVAVNVVDLTPLPEPARRAALDAHMRERMRTRFDIAALPLARWHLYRLGDDTWNLLQIEHHFVHDGWSASLFLTEIRDAYDACGRGGEPWQAPLPTQYRDYARWYQEWRGTRDFAAQSTYWLGKLEGCPAQGVTFDSELPRPARQGFTGDCLRGNVPEPVVTQIDRLCAAHNVTRFSVFLSAFALLVWRYTAETDFVVGSAFSNRRQIETAQMLGMFVNALPIRLSVDGEQAIASLVHATMRTTLEAQDNQEFPLTEIVKRLGLPRDHARNPLFQLMFAFHDSPRPLLEFGGLTGELWIEHNGSAKNDLNVVCVPNPPQPGSPLSHAGINVLWEYDTEIFTQQTAAALLAGFLHILEILAGNWETRLTDADLAGEAATARALEFGRGPRSDPPFETVHAGVDAAIRKDPDAVAVIQHDVRMTYAGLDRHARSIEARLAASGIGAGATVAVTGPVSPAFVAACLAALRRGSPYVCIDRTLPPARLELVIRDASPAAILCDDAAGSPLGQLGVPLVPVRAEPAGAAPGGPPVSGDTTAYLVYTSGSAGTPKAVVATHANAVAALHARTVYYGQAAPRTLVTLPAVFDVCGSMVFWTLWRGGTVVLPGRDASRDPDAIRALVDRHAVTHLNFVSSFYQQFLDTLPGAWRSTLKVVAVGGEACTPRMTARHAALCPDAALHNEYGPTEATVWSSASALYTPGAGITAGGISAGQPLANYLMYVLDDRWRPVPLGARGELYIGGPGVAPGYLNHPELTAGRFVTPPGGPLAGVRIYRTGDQARLGRDGRFQITGRLDDQVKIRGYRIEPGEIRSCLAGHPLVQDAFVAVRQSGDAAALVAYIAVPHGTAETAATVRAWAADRLPAYMVPATFVTLDELPLTAAGKIDQARLPRPHHPGFTTAGAPAAETNTQKRILGLWRAILGRDTVGVDEDFFAAGGDSLQAIRLATLARAQGLALSVPQLLRARTIRELAAAVDKGGPGRGTQERLGPGTRVPLTAIQSWFFAQSFANPHHFNQGRLFELATESDPGLLAGAVRWTVRRHDAFRTRFRAGEQGWHAELQNGPLSAGLEERELPASTGEDIEERVARAAEELQASLDIHASRLSRLVLLSAGDGSRRWLALVMHHLIVDAVSWDVLIGDIQSAYRRLAAGEELPAGPAPGMTAAGLRPADPPAVAYWRAAARASRVHSAEPRTGTRAPYGSLRRVCSTLSARATEYLLQDVPRFYPASTRSILLAGLHMALQPALGSGVLFAYLEGHGRDGLDEAGEAVGWLTTLYPVLLRPGRARGLTELAAAFQQQLDHVPGGGRGFGTGRYLEPDSPLGRALQGFAEPSITFNYLGRAGSAEPSGILRPSHLTAGRPIGPANVLPTPLDVTAAVSDGRLDVLFSFDEGFISAAAASEVSRRFTSIIEEASHVVALSGTAVKTQATRRYLIHPAGGAVDWYLPLARRLAPQQACFGIPQDDDENPYTLTQLAARYAARIQAFQPDGPYRLAGWSFGAAVAYEMTCLLEEQGRTVAQLTLLDPPPAGGTAAADEILALHIGQLMPWATHAGIESAVRSTALLEPSTRIAQLAGHLQITPTDEPAETGTLVRRRLSIVVRNHHALSQWTPRRRVAAGLAVLVSREPGTRAGAVDPGWAAGPHGPVTPVVVPGDHISMLRDDGLNDITTLLDGRGGAS